jgi:hypothetical protein
VAVGIAIWRASTFDTGGTTHVAGAGLCLGLMYGVVLVATREGPLPHAAQWVLSTVEVFAVSAVVFFGKEVSPGYAMTSVAWWGFPLAIGLSGLRLRVALPVYVATLSSIAAVALHGLAGGDAAAPIPSLTTPFVVQRAVLFLLMGVAGATLARAQQRMLAQVQELRATRGVLAAAADLRDRGSSRTWPWASACTRATWSWAMSAARSSGNTRPSVTS